MTKRSPCTDKAWTAFSPVFAQNRWTEKIAEQVDVHVKHDYLSESDKKDGNECRSGGSGGKWGANLFSAESN